MKVNIKYVSLLIILLLGGCDILMNDSPGIEYAEGTVYYIDLEGGFYGIITKDERHFDPHNLPSEFRVDSLDISFLYKTSQEQVDFHMWGTLIEIVDINKK